MGFFTTTPESSAVNIKFSTYRELMRSNLAIKELKFDNVKDIIEAKLTSFEKKVAVTA